MQSALQYLQSVFPIAVGSPVPAVRLPVTEVDGSPIAVGPPGAAVGSPVSAFSSPVAVGSPVTAAGSPVTEIFGCSVVVEPPVSVVGSPIVVSSPVTFGPPVIEIGVRNLLLSYVAPDIW